MKIVYKTFTLKHCESVSQGLGGVLIQVVSQVTDIVSVSGDLLMPNVLIDCVDKLSSLGEHVGNGFDNLLGQLGGRSGGLFVKVSA